MANIHTKRVMVYENGIDAPPQLAGGDATESGAATAELHKAIRRIVLDHDVAPFDKRRMIRDLVRGELLSNRSGFLSLTADGRGF
jgi:hypothetical protein